MPPLEALSTSLPFCIIASDGVSISTIHPPALGPHRAAVEAALASVLNVGVPHNNPVEGATYSVHPSEAPHGKASEVLPQTGKKGVPPRHGLGPTMLPVDGKWPQPEPAWPRSVYDAMGISPEEVSAQVAHKPGPATTDMLTQGEIARAQGFTGDCCIGCGGFSMRRNGTCLLCVDCGATTG